MTDRDFAVKRTFDVLAAGFGLVILWPVIFLGWVLASFDTGAAGLFCQQRVGRNGKLFLIYKLRTMRVHDGNTVIAANSNRITPLGAKFRRYKLDELPQLWNVLTGTMSFVGPRPDLPGFLDYLKGKDRELLRLRPGITGPASLKYRHEEEILAAENDPESYNAKVIWPDKVRINREYMQNWSLVTDIKLIIRTIFL